MKFTKYGYRIQQIVEGSGYNWLFLPGGPGLGSEYLNPLCRGVSLPGNIFLADFPLDGRNVQGKLEAEHWRTGLLDLLQNIPGAILVAHSFAAMFTLLIPEVENHLAGLVLMNTTTRDSFFEQVAAMQKKYALPDLAPAASQYHLKPDDESYKVFWDSYKHYCFTQEEMTEGEKILPLFAFNSRVYYYAIQAFFPHYKSQWHPAKIPALTIASARDYVCPAQIFTDDPHYQRPNVINRVIPQAGHCPWLLYMDKVQACFDDFLSLFEKTCR